MDQSIPLYRDLRRRAAGALLVLTLIAASAIAAYIIIDKLPITMLTLGAVSAFSLACISFITAVLVKVQILEYWLGIAGTGLLGVGITLAGLQLGDGNSSFQLLLTIGAISAVIAGVYGYSIFILEGAVVLPASVFMVIKVIGQGNITILQIEQIGLIVTVIAATLILWVRITYNGSPQISGKEATYNVLAAQLNQVASKSEIVINAIGDGVLAVDGHGIIQLINPAAQTMLGWDKADAIGLDFHSVLQLQNLQSNAIDDTQNPVVMTLQTGSLNNRSDIQILTKSSKTFQANVQVSPVGQIGSGAIIVFRDITSEKAEEREQAEFVSTASHEMRTPVAAIEGYLGLSLNPATASIDEKARSYLIKAHESAQHLGTLFQDLLDVSKADDGRMRNDPQITDISSFTSNIVESLTEKAKAKNLILYFKPGETPAIGQLRMMPVFYADVDNDHLREAVSNLVENAIKYTRTGDVSVNVSGDDKNVQITVSDTGIGIPPEDIPHLFQKFYRVDNSDTREIGGTGLGLYLTRRLVEIMGGKIWVTSEYQKGSQFIISLPRVSHEEATARLERAELSGFPGSNPS